MRWLDVTLSLAGTLVDDAPNMLDGVDGPEPIWHEVLRDSNLGTVLEALRDDLEMEELLEPGGSGARAID